MKLQVLTNGVEVKLQRNALSVIEAPTSNEEDDDFECANTQWNVSDMGSYLTLHILLSLSSLSIHELHINALLLKILHTIMQSYTGTQCLLLQMAIYQFHLVGNLIIPCPLLLSYSIYYVQNNV